MLSEAASSTKRGGQELIGGLDVRVHRNHFGRQLESFVTDLELPFLLPEPAGTCQEADKSAPFPAVFIRAPIVDKILIDDIESAEHKMVDGLELPEPTSGRQALGDKDSIEILAVLPGRHASHKRATAGDENPISPEGHGDIVALRQGNVFGTSFHPELTDDIRIHEWWLNQVIRSYDRRP